MNTVTIYHNPKCSKSCQTRDLLDGSDVDYVVVEYLKDTPSEEALAALLVKLGKSPLELIRVKESLFKDLGLSVSDDRSDSEWIKIMVDNPKLIERPIVVNGDKAVIGRPPENILGII